MAIKENLLSVISSLQSGDFLRVVTSEGASRKASISNVGRWLVENYEGSTLAGSAQSLQSAMSRGSITSMGSPLTSGTDLNTLTTFGIYYYHNPVSDLVNAPSDAGNYAMLYVVPRATESRCDQILLTNSGAYYRAQTNATQWSAWVALGRVPKQESYTPTISSSTGDQDFATDSVAFLCTKNGQMILIAGRFRITNAGTTSGSIRISLPEGIDVLDSGVGGCGNVVVDNNSGQFSPRCMSNALVISKGGGGNYSLPSIGTGYVAVSAVLMPR